MVGRNSQALQAYAKESQKRLATLPEKDPAAFQRLIDTHYDGLEMRRGPNGELLVLLDDEADEWTTWAAACAIGRVRF